jgi:5'-AMP-activated protein kinase catalytic alpha subunit
MNSRKQRSKKSLNKSLTKNSINSIFQKIKNNFTKNTFKKIKKKKSPKKISNYIIGETIGEGAFAKVKLGFHIPTKEKVAIKILNKERIDINKIKKEIKILQRLKHINIIQIYEIIETKKHLYIIMEYCNGQDLFSLIKSKHHLTEKEACKYFQQIINGVEYIHLSNITHRDLKPENLLLDDNNKRIVITDFGLSKLSEEYNNELSTPCGTMSYSPPEVLEGKKYNGIYSDIWSCGIILYVMLVGNLPCSEKERNLIYQIS